MAETGNKRKLSSRSASFLKVLEGDFSKKLTIPQAFITNFNGDIPDWFILEISGTRKGWRVDTREDGSGGFYFGYGWDEFVEEQCLENGDFLLFGYEEPLILQVKIFKKDGTEKITGTDMELDYEVESSERRRQSPKTHHVGANLWSARPSNRFEENEKLQEVIDKTEMETADQSGMQEKHHDHMNPFEMKTDKAYADGVHGQQHGDNVTTASETGASLNDQSRVHEKQLEKIDRIERKAAKVAATQQGVCFTLTWRKVPHLYYYLTFPRAMVTKKTLSGDGTVILQDQEGNTWPMKLRVRPGGRVDLTKGWKEFLIETDVRDGDILTFEFVSEKVIQVDIERVARVDQLEQPSERANTTEPMAFLNVTCEEPAINYTAINYNVPETNGETKRVLFIVDKISSFSTIWKNNKKGSSYLHIPKPIAVKQKLENQETVMLCDPEGMQWPMKVRTRPSDGRVGLAQGWNTFLKHQKISDGDTLNFEFVSDHVMKVDIIRAMQVHPALRARRGMKQEVMQLD